MALFTQRGLFRFCTWNVVVCEFSFTFESDELISKNDFLIILLRKNGTFPLGWRKWVTRSHMYKSPAVKLCGFFIQYKACLILFWNSITFTSNFVLEILNVRVGKISHFSVKSLVLFIIERLDRLGYVSCFEIL